MAQINKPNIYFLLIMPLLLGCAWFTTEEVSQSYAGKIELLSFSNIGEETIIEFQLSGGEWVNNSASIFKDAKVNVEGNNIYITVRKCLASGKGDTPKYQIILNRLNAGWYTLYYRNPDKSSTKLTEIKIL